jgi:hypothetical protein
MSIASGEIAVGKLYDAVRVIDDMIELKGLDANETRGLIGMKAGFFLVIITPETPDDPQKLRALREAAEEVLGQSVSF